MASRLMRAIRVAQFGAPEVLQLVDNVPVPKPSGKQVLIKVKYSGVNPVETYMRAGNYAILPSLPFTPGSDLGGVVEHVGAEVRKFKPGDRVFTVRTDTGSYAEFALASEFYTYPLHDKLDFKQGAALGIPYFSAYKALVIRGNAISGETILIHGASGAVGLAACQMARAFGCHVIGTAGTQQGEALAQKCGAHKTYCHKEEGYMDKIKRDYPDGVDVLVEMLANVNLEKNMAIMGRRGRVMIVGSRGSLDFTPRGTILNEVDIRGSTFFATTEAEFKQTSSALLAGCETGWVKPEVGLVYPLEEAKLAHKEVIEHAAGGATGRIVLEVD